MATIALTNVAGPYLNEDTTPQLTTVTWTEAETTGNTVTVNKPTLLQFWNTEATTARTVTVTSTHDAYGRLAHITAFSIAAGTIVSRIFHPDGWESSAGGGTMSFTVSGASVDVAAIPLS